MVQYFRIVLVLVAIGVAQAKNFGQLSPTDLANKNIATSRSEYIVRLKEDDWLGANFFSETEVPGSCLVSINSEAEKEELDKYLDQYGPNSYWTSGYYNFSMEDWVWKCNGNIVPLPPHTHRPWALGHPKTPTLLLRIVVNDDFENHSWSTHPYSEEHSYICERKLGF